MTCAQQKETLRRRALQLPKAQAAELLAEFARLPQVECARTVMLFYGVGKEPDTAGLIHTLLAQGKRVALPVCLPGRRIEARIVAHEGRLVPGRYGIPEPDGRCPTVSPEEIDAVLVPCLLCDRSGYRLGRGGGYYDRWLAGYRGFTAAVCPSDRLVDRLPHEPWDIPVGLVLVGT